MQNLQYTTEFQDIFFHHIILYLDITQFRSLVVNTFVGTKRRWFLLNWQKNSNIKVINEKLWYINGKKHREDGPAVEYTNGDKEWWINDQCHREDGPAIEYCYKAWYTNGQLHRIDGPAVEYTNGDKEWYLYGILHRLDGPAIENSDGTKWWINGKRNYNDVHGFD